MAESGLHCPLSSSRRQAWAHSVGPSPRNRLALCSNHGCRATAMAKPRSAIRPASVIVYSGQIRRQRSLAAVEFGPRTWLTCAVGLMTTRIEVGLPRQERLSSIGIGACKTSSGALARLRAVPCVRLEPSAPGRQGGHPAACVNSRPARATAGPIIPCLCGYLTPCTNPHLLESGQASSPSLTHHHPWCQHQGPSLRWIQV